MKKTLMTIKKVMIWLFAIIFFGFVIVMTGLLLYFNDFGVTVFGKKSLVIIREELASEDYKRGQLVIVENRKLKEVKAGDKVFAYKVLEGGKVTIEYGTVGEVTVGRTAKESYVTFENGDAYQEQYFIGYGTKTYNKVGTYLSVLESRWGFLFIILVPCFLVFIYQIYALIIEIKYGNEEEK